VLDLPLPSLRPGEGANFCLVDLDAAWDVGDAGYESRSENCCFAGRRLRGRVLATVAGGDVVYRERNFAVTAA
jgi:dihydroorotase